MGRKSKVALLLQPIEASEEARERVKIMLLTLAEQWSVKDGMDRLGISRTRFQDLRGRMLEGALAAIERGVAGRPPKRVPAEHKQVRVLRHQVADLTHELRLVRASLDISESSAADAVRERVKHVLQGKRGGAR